MIEPQPIAYFAGVVGIFCGSLIFGMAFSNRLLDAPHKLKHRFGAKVVGITVVFSTVVFILGGVANSDYALLSVASFVGTLIVLIAAVVVEAIVGIFLIVVFYPLLSYLKPPEILQEDEWYDR